MPFLAGDLRTGSVRVRNLPVASGDTSVVLGAAGTIQCVIPLPLVNPDDDVMIPFAQIIIPGKSFLAYEERIELVDGDGNSTGVTAKKLINGGPIWSDVYDWDNKTITVTAAGMRSIFNYRLVLSLLLDANIASLPTFTSVVQYTAHYRTIAKRLVQDALANVGGRLPIDFEADITGASVRTYLESEAHRVNEKLEQISGIINGPDIAFRPAYGADENHVRWMMMTGNPELKQAGADWAFDTTAVVSSVRGTQTTRDASSLINAAYGFGDGIMAKSIDTTLMQPNRIVNRAINPRYRNDATGFALLTNAGAVHVASWQSGIGRESVGAARVAVTTGSATEWAHFIQPVAPEIDAGDVAFLSCWVRSSTVETIRARIYTYTDEIGSAGQAIGPDGGDVTLVANVWTRITVSGTLAGGVGSSRPSIRGAASTTGGTIDIDDVMYVTGSDPGDWQGATADTDAHDYNWLGIADASESVRFGANGYPRLEGAITANSVTTPSVLQEALDGVTRLGRAHVSTWKFQANKAMAPRVTDYAEGDYITMTVSADNPYNSGEVRLRIVQIATKHDEEFASIICAPERF